MGKVRQIFVWNGKEDLGPFRRDELVEQLAAGAVLPSDYYFEEGMSGWERVARLPCCTKILATDAQRQMLDRMGVHYDEFLTKSGVTSILESQPATERQLDYLKSFGVELPVVLTKTEASNMIERCLDDPAATERQNQFRALEFEKTQREREAFPSYYLKQDVLAAQRDVSTVKREYDEKEAELSEYRRELAETQVRLKNASDKVEMTALEQQITSIQDLVESVEKGIADGQPAEVKEAYDELHYRQSLRKKFWKATFTQLGTNRDDDDDLIDYADVIDQLYDSYGRHFKAPTLKQIDEILDCLDTASPDWDRREHESFFVKYNAQFGGN